MNLIFSLRPAGKGLPRAVTSTSVYGKDAIAPSLNQIAPCHRFAPILVSSAIQWIRATRNPLIVPLTVICG